MNYLWYSLKIGISIRIFFLQFPSHCTHYYYGTNTDCNPSPCRTALPIFVSILLVNYYLFLYCLNYGDNINFHNLIFCLFSHLNLYTRCWCFCLIFFLFLNLCIFGFLNLCFFFLLRHNRCIFSLCLGLFCRLNSFSFDVFVDQFFFFSGHFWFYCIQL